MPDNSVTIAPAPGSRADVTSLAPGQGITETLTGVWTAHKDRHRELCGPVIGPLRNLICRQGHTL